MAPTGIWTGTISFSLVAIPVQLVRAVQSSRVSFRLLHQKDYAPLARQMFCPADNQLIPPEDIARGYEIGPDRYLLVSDEELEAVSPGRSRTIEIVEFVELAEIDPVYYDHPYYLVPAPGGAKAYHLLAEILARSNKAGLAKFVLREREYLVAVTSTGKALALLTLHYHDEILPEPGLEPTATVVTAADQNRLRESITARLGDFHPETYADRRRARIEAFVQKKAANAIPVEAPDLEADAGSGPADLIATLEESMRQAKKSQ